MESSMPREVARSLEAVARLVHDHNVQCAHFPCVFTSQQHCLPIVCPEAPF